MLKEFYTLTNLQGSQTCTVSAIPLDSFTLLQTYKVLKRRCKRYAGRKSFTLLQTYKVLKLVKAIKFLKLCFTLLQTYKVLKLTIPAAFGTVRFTLLQTYKVLKPQMRLSPSQNILVICVSHLVMYKTQIFIY